MQYPEQESVSGAVPKRKIGQEVNQDGKQHKENHTEKDSVKYMGAEYIQNMAVGNPVGGTSGILDCIPVFLISSQ